ncbi:hypothetical protein FVE85_9309 [Porphyridium purpureum]|uniref:Uncharacterized protein n=1 Tax=Porphyridium purpureum TaxID=35688 RepID=A0A5J4YRJ6_PORPP|nr:hypothetical protein FVE85_9309 [Porphyridium purpureum]|eukprot:POR1224..scf222_8
MSKNLFGRVAQWLVNEVMVKTLSNSPAFQRFALRVHESTQKLAQKAAETTKELAESEATKEAQERAASTAQNVRETVVGLAQLYKDQIVSALYKTPRNSSSGPPTKRP